VDYAVWGVGGGEECVGFGVSVGVGVRERAAVLSEKQAEWLDFKMTVQVCETVNGV
jgi:hypothetical protein